MAGRGIEFVTRKCITYLHCNLNISYNLQRMRSNLRTFKKHFKKVKWHKPTWYSKLWALVFFVAALPIITFTLGVEYQKTISTLDYLENLIASNRGNYISVSHGSSDNEVKMTIYKPADAGSYAKKIADFEAGKFGNKSLLDVIAPSDFVARDVIVKLVKPYDIQRETANVTAGQVQSQVKLQVTNFVVENGTAFVELNIDNDGFAGVSFVKDYANPIIRRSLLQFPEIKKVIFGPAKFEQPPQF